MTEIEKKALTLLNERHSPYEYAPDDHPVRVLARAIEQHEAYKQDVSDAVEATLNTMLRIHGASTDRLLRKCLGYFIIPKADPLVEAMIECGFGDSSNAASDIREALAKRGLKIVEDTDADQEV